mgnify:CR=1 FL=1
MKLPKEVKRYCKHCKKHTTHKVIIASSGHKRSAMKKGSKDRARLRGRARGSGNLGRWSKPAITKWKRKTKSTKKTNLNFKCLTCNKSSVQRKGKRTSKFQIKEGK